MRFLSLFRDGKVKPAWEFKTSGNLWRILFSDSGRIVGEDREAVKKTVTFFCLNESTGEVLWSGLQLDEPWWIGIETIYGGIVYLHEYVKPDLPQHKKIIALDLETGKLLWKNEELQPLFVAEGKLYAAKDFFEKRVYVELNPTTGEIEREFVEEEGTVDFGRRVEADRLHDLVFPEVFNEEVAGYSTLASLIRLYCDLLKLAGNIEYIERENLLFFNYHEQVGNRASESPRLMNRLKVVNADRKRLIYSEVLNENVLAPTPDSFFLKGRQLFFIKNKNTLVAVRIEDLQQRK